LLETGALAPHFTLLGVDGKEYSLPKDAGGEPTLLVFFKTTCGTCDTAFPYVNRLRETYPEGWRRTRRERRRSTLEARESPTRY